MLSEIKEWLSVASLLIAVGGFLYAWLTSGSKKATAELDAFRKTDAEKKREIEKDLDEHDRRIQSLEQEMKHLPDKDAVVELKLAISELKGTVGQHAEVLNGVARTVHRVENYLIEGKKI